jgi:DNA mismatch repair protein MSH6
MTKMELLKIRDKPSFLLPENIMDKNMRKPSDPNYDPSSIFISKEEFSELTDGMKRYWEIKKNNMDKVLLYRFGDWYV